MRARTLANGDGRVLGAVATTAGDVKLKPRVRGGLAGDTAGADADRRTSKSGLVRWPAVCNRRAEDEDKAGAAGEGVVERRTATGAAARAGTNAGGTAVREGDRTTAPRPAAKVAAATSRGDDESQGLRMLGCRHYRTKCMPCVEYGAHKSRGSVDFNEPSRQHIVCWTKFLGSSSMKRARLGRSIAC